MLDFIKLAAATSATSKASWNQIDQLQTNSANACTIGTEGQQGQKHLEELGSQLPHCVSPVPQLNQTCLVLPTKKSLGCC